MHVPAPVTKHLTRLRPSQVIKMLMTIVIVFALCWAPLHIFQMLVHFYPEMNNQKTKLSYYTYVGAYYVTHWLAMAHSFVNPFVYCFMCDNFRVSIFSAPLDAWWSCNPYRSLLLCHLEFAPSLLTFFDVSRTHFFHAFPLILLAKWNKIVGMTIAKWSMCNQIDSTLTVQHAGTRNKQDGANEY